MNPMLVLLMKTLVKNEATLNEAERDYLAWLRRLQAQVAGERS